MGHSDGGRMAQDCAVELAEKAGFVIAFNSTYMAKSPRPTHPVPIAFVSNTTDRFLPRYGGAGLFSRLGGVLGFFRTGLVHSTNMSGSLGPEGAERIWAETNGCENKNSPQVTFDESSGFSKEVHHYRCRTPTESYYYGNTDLHGLLINRINVFGNHGIPDKGNIGHSTFSNDVATAGRAPAQDLVSKYLPYLLGGTDGISSSHNGRSR